MKDERGLYYHPQAGNSRARVYVRRGRDGEVEFRLWQADHPEVWERHPWLSLSVVQNAARLYKEERNQEADPLKLIEKATALIRAVSLKNSTDIKTANLKNVAFESFKEDIFDAMAKENPELYRSLVQFINSKSQEE